MKWYKIKRTVNESSEEKPFFQPGDEVELLYDDYDHYIGSLEAGMLGTVVEYRPKSGRYVVKLENGKTAALVEAMLKLVDETMDDVKKREQDKFDKKYPRTSSKPSDFHFYDEVKVMRPCFDIDNKKKKVGFGFKGIVFGTPSQIKVRRGIEDHVGAYFPDLDLNVVIPIDCLKVVGHTKTSDDFERPEDHYTQKGSDGYSPRYTGD